MNSASPDCSIAGVILSRFIGVGLRDTPVLKCIGPVTGRKGKDLLQTIVYSRDSALFPVSYSCPWGKKLQGLLLLMSPMDIYSIFTYTECYIILKDLFLWKHNFDLCVVHSTVPSKPIDYINTKKLSSLFSLIYIVPTYTVSWFSAWK